MSWDIVSVSEEVIVVSMEFVFISVDLIPVATNYIVLTMDSIVQAVFNDVVGAVQYVGLVGLAIGHEKGSHS